MSGTGLHSTVPRSYAHMLLEPYAPMHPYLHSGPRTYQIATRCASKTGSGPLAESRTDEPALVLGLTIRPEEREGGREKGGRGRGRERGTVSYTHLRAHETEADL
eukprot:2063332-Rhodomonas_salina.1